MDFYYNTFLRYWKAKTKKIIYFTNKNPEISLIPGGKGTNSFYLLSASSSKDLR